MHGINDDNMGKNATKSKKCMREFCSSQRMAILCTQNLAFRVEIFITHSVMIAMWKITGLWTHCAIALVFSVCIQIICGLFCDCQEYYKHTGHCVLNLEIVGCHC